MRTRCIVAGVLFALLGTLGCKKNQPAFGELHPVKGTVKRGGKAVSGGVVTFAFDPEKTDFLINGEVGTDGSYTLSTVRTTDKSGERKKGAPAGTFKVTYHPPQANQGPGASTEPVQLSTPVTVKAGDNDIPVELKK